MMLTTFDDDEYVHDALDNGAIGYMLKDIPSSNLIDSIRAINNGTIQMSPSVAAKFIQKVNLKEAVFKLSAVSAANSKIKYLSIREKEILYLLSKGLDNRQISELLFIAEQTVKNHISKIYNKLDNHERIKVIQIAKDANLEEDVVYLKNRLN